MPENDQTTCPKQLNLDAIMDLHGKTTPGFWVAGNYTHDPKDTPPGVACSEIEAYIVPPGVIVHEPDVTFVAIAHAVVPDLVAKVRELESTVARLQDERIEAVRKVVAEVTETFVTAKSLPTLTDSQRKELTLYVQDYLGRGIKGVWHELATAIAAMMNRMAELEPAATGDVPDLAGIRERHKSTDHQLRGISDYAQVKILTKDAMTLLSTLADRDRRIVELKSIRDAAALAMAACPEELHGYEPFQKLCGLLNGTGIV